MNEKIGRNCSCGSGTSVSYAGDVNGDGVDDIIIGAPSSNAGKSYLIYGKKVGLANINLASLTSSQGIIITGSSGKDISTGSFVRGVKDINGDGINDIIIGSSGNKIYLIYGKSSLTNINLALLTSTQGIIITSPATYPTINYAGDVNGDGKPDIIIGSNGNGYVVYGASSGFVTLTPTVMTTEIPTALPTIFPSVSPTSPTAKPTSYSTVSPTIKPTTNPTRIPTAKPTDMPTALPTSLPTTDPSSNPTATPTHTPTFMPTQAIYINTGGIHNGTLFSDNFIINSSVDVVITGGSGADMYTLKPNANVLITVTDFNRSSDVINLQAYDIHSFDDINITAGSIIITLEENQRMRLVQLSPGDINADNFIFTSSPAVTPTPIPSSEKQTTSGASTGLSLGAIVGMAIGGTALIVAGSYIMYTKLFTPASSSQIVKITPEVYGKGIASDQHPPAPNELVVIEPSAPQYIPIVEAYAVGDTQLQVIGHVEHEL